MIKTARMFIVLGAIILALGIAGNFRTNPNKALELLMYALPLWFLSYFTWLALRPRVSSKSVVGLSAIVPIGYLWAGLGVYLHVIDNDRDEGTSFMYALGIAGFIAMLIGGVMLRAIYINYKQQKAIKAEFSST